MPWNVDISIIFCLGLYDASQFLRTYKTVDSYIEYDKNYDDKVIHIFDEKGNISKNSILTIPISSSIKKGEIKGY